MPKQNIFQKVVDGAKQFMTTRFSDKKAIGLNFNHNSNLGFGAGSGMYAGGYDMSKGLRKPSNITFRHLREIAKYDAVVRICINVIKKEVSQSEFTVVPKKGKIVSQKDIDKANALFTTINSNGESQRVLFDRVIEDLMVLDAGVIEKVFNAKKEIVELNSVDGSTIRPCVNAYGEMDPEKAYVQVIGDKVVAEFKLNELIYMMQNPQNDIYSFGYGLSPIESILLQVQSALQADLYNAQTFSKDNVPPGILDLGGMGADDARQFIATWNATVIDNTHKLKFVYGSDVAKKYIPFQNNNKDMQFVEYLDWLTRLKLATYGLTAQDANIIQDVNRATAQVQAMISKSRGVNTIKRLFEEYITREILLPSGFVDLQFKAVSASTLEEKKIQADIDKIYLDTSVVTPQYIADREGFVLEEGDMITDYDDVDAPILVPETEAEIDMQENDVLNPDSQEAMKSFSKRPYYRPLYQ